MGMYVSQVWDDDYLRKGIKQVFGNRKNFDRFCEIADDLLMKTWLSTFQRRRKENDKQKMCYMRKIYIFDKR